MLLKQKKRCLHPHCEIHEIRRDLQDSVSVIQKYMKTHRWGVIERDQRDNGPEREGHTLRQ